MAETVEEPIQQSEAQAPTKKPGKRRPKEVKAQIIDAAITAFTRDGYAGARMRSIATDAGISVQLLLHHVKSKELLWHMMMEDILERYERYRPQTEPLSGAASAADRLRQSIADLVHFTAQMPQLHRIMTNEGGQLTPRMIWLTENLTKKSYQDWCALIAEAQREGAVREGSPGRLRFAILAMTAVPFAVSAEYEYLTGKSPFTRGEIAQTIDLICNMVFIDKR